MPLNHCDNTCTFMISLLKGYHIKGFCPYSKSLHAGYHYGIKLQCHSQYATALGAHVAHLGCQYLPIICTMELY